MALTALRNSFTGKALGLGLAVTAAITPLSATFAQDASAQNASYMSQQCAPLHTTSTGRPIAAVVSAHMYSQENIGAVGIPINAGRDLGDRSPHELGAMLVEGLRRTGVEAKCFVHYEAAPNGTGVNFVINGFNWDNDGALNISEALNVETIRAVSAEARMTRLMLASNEAGPQQVGLNK